MDSVQKLRVMMFGFVADDTQIEEAFRREPSPQLSAVKFQRAIIDGLVQNGASVEILSSMPIASYPHNKLLIRGQPFTLSLGAAGRVMSFLNLPLVKLLNRFVAAMIGGFQTLRQQRSNMIFCYSLHSPFLLTAMILRSITGTAVTVMINDLPMNMAGKRERGLRGMAKRIDNRLLHTLVSRADLVLPVAKGIIDDWLPEAKAYLVVEAIAPQPPSPLPIKASSATKSILYAGHFSHVINFASLFTAASDLDAHLTFVGGGPEERALKQLAEDDPRITVKPFMRGAVFESELQQADFFVNARSSTWEGGKYAFSYKLFDYMSFGRPILSTPMPGIPDEYFHCFLRIDDTSQARFHQTMTDALTVSTQALRARVDAGLRMMTIEKSSRAFGKLIAEEMTKAQNGDRARSRSGTHKRDSYF